MTGSKEENEQMIGFYQQSSKKFFMNEIMTELSRKKKNEGMNED